MAYKFISYIFTYRSEEDIVAGVQFLLDEENLLKLIIVEEEDTYEGDDDEEEEELVREEKEEDRHDKKGGAVDERRIEIGETHVEEGTSGGYFDLLPVSD